ncbi:MAG: SDR family oxidoreductase [Clostridia bacterium]|nr:SDR family oxidoreductase [Clostridia bacterium]
MKTVLITGASRGIGKAIAKEFAQKGYKVFINYNKSKESAISLAEEIDAVAVCADISKREEVKKMFDIIREISGGVDVLVNNAGISQIKLFSDITEQDWDEMFGINVKGLYNCTQEAIPYMINKKCGKIINISSMWGVTGASCEVHYSASKAAVIGFTKALAKELGPSGICVNSVAPGVIMTDMCAELSEEDIEMLKEETPLGRVGTAEEVAKTVMFLASSESDFITGQVLGINGGMVV